MEFKKKLKIRWYTAAAFILLGIALIVVAVLGSFENDFFVAYGGALIVMGILRLIQHRRITKDEKSVRDRELAESDERFRMISERARSLAFSWSIVAAGIVVIVLSLMGKHDAAQPFAWYVCGMAALYWIFWVILGKKY